MDRKVKTLGDDIVDLLNLQIEHEFENYFIYLNFASQMSLKSLKQGEEYYRIRAEEERKHAFMIIDYLIKNDGKLEITKVENKILKTELSLLSIFELTLEREILTTEKLYYIWEEAKNNGEIGVCSWLESGLIRIQENDEEPESRDALKIISMGSSSDLLKIEKIRELLN